MHINKGSIHCRTLLASLLLAGLSACATSPPSLPPAPEPPQVEAPPPLPEFEIVQPTPEPELKPVEPQLPSAAESIALPDAPVPIQENLPPTPKEILSSEAQSDYEQVRQALLNGDMAAVTARLSEMTQDYPQYAGPHVNLGLLYLKDGRLAEAESAFLAALEINPQEAVSYNHLGVVYRQQGRFEEALAAYQKALELAPGYANAHLNYAILLDLYQGRPGEALTHYQQYEQLAAAPDDRVAKWILDVQRRAQTAQQ